MQDKKVETESFEMYSLCSIILDVTVVQIQIWTTVNFNNYGTEGVLTRKTLATSAAKFWVTLVHL
jgi:hypothetical protein